MKKPKEGELGMSSEGKRKKPFYKRWWVWIAAVIIVIIAASSSGDTETQPTSTTTDAAKADTTTKDKEKADQPKEEEEKQEQKAQTYGIGETATVANVGFTVNSVKTSDTFGGGEFMEPAKASGKFVIVDVSIKNGQKESLTIDSSYFKLKKKDGTTYDASTDGDVIMAMGDESFFLSQINPGIQKSGKIVFDVPKSLDVSKTILHCQTGFFGTETVNVSLKEAK